MSYHIMLSCVPLVISTTMSEVVIALLACQSLHCWPINHVDVFVFCHCWPVNCVDVCVAVDELNKRKVNRQRRVRLEMRHASRIRHRENRQMGFGE